MDSVSVKKAIVDHGLRMIKDGLTTGTGGNISVKLDGHIYITPSAIEYNDLLIDDISVLDLHGNHTGEGKKPSSEKNFHVDIYKKREDVTSIIHTHSTYAAALSCLKKEIPPIHYLVALCGDKVPVAEYAKFGTKELSLNIVKALKDYNAVLMANHGLAAVGSSIDMAYSVALNMEFVSKVYVEALGTGLPVFKLTKEEIESVEADIKAYIGKGKKK